MSLRAVIDLEDFTRLVAGEATTVSALDSAGNDLNVEIILSDFGFAAMFSAVRRAAVDQYRQQDGRSSAKTDAP